MKILWTILYIISFNTAIFSQSSIGTTQTSLSAVSFCIILIVAIFIGLSVLAVMMPAEKYDLTVSYATYCTNIKFSDQYGNYLDANTQAFTENIDNSMYAHQSTSIIEWEEHDNSMIFHKFTNNIIKKDTRLIVRPGQDAIFLYNGKIEGIFKDDGEYNITSDIIPLLTTLNKVDSNIIIEILFVNTKELEITWETQNPINIPTSQLPGGMPIKAKGILTFKINDYINLIDKVAGVKIEYRIDDIRQRITSYLDQLLMKWISKEGKDMFNLQVNSFEIAKGIQEDLDMKVYKDGMTITDFNIISFNYPQEIQDMINRVASQSFISNMNPELADDLEKYSHSTSDKTSSSNQEISSSEIKFCSECGTKIVTNNKFCSNCGNKL